MSFLMEGMGLLNQIQRKWVYLEPIFGRGALPSQQQRFRNVDEEFRRVMATLEMTKKVRSMYQVQVLAGKFRLLSGSGGGWISESHMCIVGMYSSAGTARSACHVEKLQGTL